MVENSAEIAKPISVELPQLLNLGCGKRFHSRWINVDFFSESAAVMAYDLRCGIPFEDGRFDVVYHSHVLEHFTAPAGLRFLRECYRVTRRGGLIRIAVPDLERIASTYLRALGEAVGGSLGATQDYEWIKLELLDQMAREESGGQMRRYLENPGIPNPDFVVERLGVEALKLMKSKAAPESSAQPSAPVRMPPQRRFWLKRIRERILRWLLGDEYSALTLGRFRRGGEVHLWMYDRYSLGAALRAAGYGEPTVRRAAESGYPEWNAFYLDTEPDGSSYKPDSLYMEAVKR